MTWLSEPDTLERDLIAALDKRARKPAAPVYSGTLDKPAPRVTYAPLVTCAMSYGPRGGTQWPNRFTRTPKGAL